jgi:pyruvate/2-oxoglutarate dehydrogenase complex dihydrolipoamide dehydrogenase (E3) component
MIDVLVIGGGPAGVVAALRAADAGAKTVLVTRDAFGGMAANDGPVPVRTLAHAARLMRDASQLGKYGIVVGEPLLNFPALLNRVRQVVQEVQQHSTFRSQIDSLGVTVHENTGSARFVDAHTLETASGLGLQAAKTIICTGGISRQLTVPGAEFVATHSDAWSLTCIPESILVLGAGATGAQVASVFNAFGSKIQLFHSGPRILATEDEEVSRAVANAFRNSGVQVRENFGTIDLFEKTATGVRMWFSKEGRQETVEASLVVSAIGWTADTADLGLECAGVETDKRGFVRVDDFLRTSCPNIFAAGDVTGKLMLVPQAIQQGFVAATNAVRGPVMTDGSQVAPVGSFTDPEYAQVGLTEAKAREGYDVATAKIGFDSTTRTIIDGRTYGFCKLIVDCQTRLILGCHVVGERAVDITQIAAVAMAARMRVDDLARVPLSFPTYAGALGRVAAKITRQLNLTLDWSGSQGDEV